MMLNMGWILPVVDALWSRKPALAVARMADQRPFIGPSVKVMLAACILICAPKSFAENPEFAGVSRGMAEADLPTTLEPDSIRMRFRGVVEGDFLEVTVMDGRVANFQVIYLGKTPDLEVVSKSITLAQAVQKHSSGLNRAPRLARAVSLRGVPTGLADTANAILYFTGGSTNPDAVVQNVFYGSDDAPFTKVARSQFLEPQEAASLLATASPDAVDAPKEVSVVAAEDYLRAQTPDQARQVIESVSDRAIGTGRRVLALIDKAEIWLSVDPSHEEARGTFCQLLDFSVRHSDSARSLDIALKENRGLLDGEAIRTASEAQEIGAQVDRRMRQVRAMGYDALLCTPSR